MMTPTATAIQENRLKGTAFVEDQERTMLAMLQSQVTDAASMLATFADNHANEMLGGFPRYLWVLQKNVDFVTRSSDRCSIDLCLQVSPSPTLYARGLTATPVKLGDLDATALAALLDVLQERLRQG